MLADLYMRSFQKVLTYVMHGESVEKWVNLWICEMTNIKNA